MPDAKTVSYCSRLIDNSIRPSYRSALPQVSNAQGTKRHMKKLHFTQVSAFQVTIQMLSVKTLGNQKWFYFQNGGPHHTETLPRRLGDLLSFRGRTVIALACYSVFWIFMTSHANQGYIAMIRHSLTTTVTLQTIIYSFSPLSEKLDSKQIISKSYFSHYWLLLA